MDLQPFITITNIWCGFTRMAIFVYGSICFSDYFLWNDDFLGCYDAREEILRMTVRMAAQAPSERRLRW